MLLPETVLLVDDGRYFVAQIDWAKLRIKSRDDFATITDAEEFASTYGRYAIMRATDLDLPGPSYPVEIRNR